MWSLAHTPGATLASSLPCLPTHNWLGLFLIREAIFSHNISLFFSPTHPSEMLASLWYLSKWLHLRMVLQIHLTGSLSRENCPCNLVIQPPGGRTVLKRPGVGFPWISLNLVQVSIQFRNLFCHAFRIRLQPLLGHLQGTGDYEDSPLYIEVKS